MTPKSILHEKLNGVIVVTGLPGIGKTTLAMTAENPALHTYIDFDKKGEAQARDYGLVAHGNYHAPNFLGENESILDYDPMKIADWTTNILKTLPPGTTTITFDNATALEVGLSAIVKKNPEKYGINRGNVEKNAYGGANPGVGVLWENTVQWLQNRGVKLIILVNHMSSPWVDGKPVPNRFSGKGNKALTRLSIGTFVLVTSETDRGGKPPIPSALVIKEALAAVRKWDEETGAFETRRALPFRVPVMDWPHIRGYFETPADFEHPAAGETWSSGEINSYGAMMSKEMMEWIRDTANMSYSEDGGEHAPAATRPPQPQPAARPAQRLQPAQPPRQPSAQPVKQANTGQSAPEAPKSPSEPPVAAAEGKKVDQKRVDAIKGTWFNAAVAVKMVSGPKDAAGLETLKATLGDLYHDVSKPGAAYPVIEAAGLEVINKWTPA